MLFGDVGRPELIERLRERTPAAFILTMDNPVLVNRLARNLRRAFPDLPIIARARDTAHAAELYKAGVTDAVPETFEASLQLSEAALVDLGVAMGPVIASIHEKRDELRAQIKSRSRSEDTAPLGTRRRRKFGDLAWALARYFACATTCSNCALVMSSSSPALLWPKAWAGTFTFAIPIDDDHPIARRPLRSSPWGRRSCRSTTRTAISSLAFAARAGPSLLTAARWLSVRSCRLLRCRY